MLNIFTFMEGLRNKQALNILSKLIAEKTYDLSTYKAMKHCLGALRKADDLKNMLTHAIFDTTDEGCFVLLEDGRKAYVSMITMESAFVSDNAELVALAKAQFERDCDAIASYLDKFNNN